MSDRGRAAQAIDAQSFLTWSKPTSTGVSRPKIDTSTLSLAASSLISEISPEKSDSGPETTLTDSPIVNWARVRVAVATSLCSSRSTSHLGQRHGLLGGADEAGHAGGALDDAPGVLVELHVDEHVAGHRALLDGDLLVVLHLRDGFGRHDDAAHGALLAERDDAVLEVVLDLVLVAGVGVDDVPAKHSDLRG